MKLPPDSLNCAAAVIAAVVAIALAGKPA